MRSVLELVVETIQQTLDRTKTSWCSRVYPFERVAKPKNLIIDMRSPFTLEAILVLSNYVAAQAIWDIVRCMHP